MILRKVSYWPLRGIFASSLLILSACLAESVSETKDVSVPDIKREILLDGKVEFCFDSRVVIKPEDVLGYLDTAQLKGDGLKDVQQWVESQDMLLRTWDKGQSSWVPSGTRLAENLCDHAIKKNGNLYRAVFPDRLEHGEPAQKIKLAAAGIMPVIATYNFWFEDEILVLIEAMGEQTTSPLYIYDPKSSKQ